MILVVDYKGVARLELSFKKTFSLSASLWPSKIRRHFGGWCARESGATRLGMVLRLETPAFDNRSIFSYFSLSDTIKRPKESQILEIEKRSQPQTITKKTKIQIRKLWICEMNLRIFLIIILELIGAIKTNEKTFREKRNFSRVKSKEVRFQQILMVPQQMLHFYLLITFKLLALYW